MKCLKFMVSIVTLFIGVTTPMLSAQQADSISHKHQMIDAINKGFFDIAAKKIPYVKDWNVDWKQESELIDIDASLNFLEYADSIHLQTSILDSLTLYIARTSDLFGYYYHGEGDFNNALQYWELSAYIYKSILGENHPDHAALLVNIGVLYSNMGDYTKAEHYFVEALRIKRIVLGENHPDYAMSLSNLGTLYLDMGDYSKAEPYIVEALSIRKSIHSENHPNYAISLSNLGVLYHRMCNYAKAEPYYLEALSIQKFIFGKNHPDCAMSLSNLGALYYDMGNYAKAEPYFLEALSIRKSILGENHPDYAALLVNIGGLYSNMGDYTKAEHYFVEALRIQEFVLGKNHPDYATSLNNLGVLYSSMGNYAKAEPYFVEGLKIEKIVLGENHPAYATSLNNLGTLYLDMGNYTKAEPYHLEALSIRRSILGENHPDYAASLVSLGKLYSIMGDYSKAEPYFVEGLKIEKIVLGKNHPDYAMSLSILGNLYLKMGDYSKAESYFVEALSIRKSILSENHPDYAGLLVNLGNLYSNMGDYTKAEHYFVEALRIERIVLGENHPDYARSLNNLGALYSNMGDYSKAEPYYLEALSIQKFIFGKNHPDYAMSLSNLGILYRRMGDYSKAEQFYLKVLSIRKSAFGKNHPDYAGSLNNLGALYFDMGDYSKAESYFVEALSIRKSILSESHPNYAMSSHNLGILYSEIGNYIKAEQYYTKAIQIFEHFFLYSTSFMSEQQRKTYWQTMQWYFTNNYTCFTYKYHIHNPSISTFAYNNELFVKGLLLNSSETVKRSILESNDTTLISQWNELTTKKQQIQVLQEKEPRSDYLKQIQEEAEQLEKQITRSSAAYRENQAMWQITWDSVQNHLSSNDVAIEYFSAPLSEDSTMYCALLLRHDSQYPELIPLFEEKEVSSYLSTSKGNITNQTYDYYSNGDTISQLVWSKILPYINEGETIYFAPSGLLHQLAIEYLPYDENHTMSDVYNMVRLSSTREIVLNKQDTEYTTATIYGGMAYDLEEDILLAESENYATENLLASRSIENDTLNRGNVRYLPGTKKEAESINALLKQNNISAKLYTTAKANEESFKALSGKHSNILHIGTHGFTWTDSVAKKQDYFTQHMQLQTLDGSNRFITPTIDPLNRCGLLFAGANIALQGNSKNLPEGVQDGILTAKEISLLDLRDANLVVLSACETAKGDITSEGVFGLQRAFKMAGVQTIIMSLWKVNDQATQLLMTEFYNNWIGKHQSKREAFRNAQNTVRTKYEEPIYWAGFIMLD